MPRRRLRSSLAGLSAIVALAAVILSLLMPLLRPAQQTGPPAHGSFVMTAANRAQCISCHAGSPSAGAARQPGSLASRVSTLADDVVAYVRSLAERPAAAPAAPPPAPPPCSGMAQSGPRASCVQCHAASM